jgi:hypothetical protein
MHITLRRIALHIALFVVVLVVLTVIAVWLGLGPIVHSEAGTAGSETLVEKR